MKKSVKLALILFTVNFAIFAIGDALHVNDFLLYLFMLPVSIAVSFILLIIFAVRNTRKRYLAKDALQRKASRKKGLIIFSCIAVVLIAAYIIFMFACGYKMPGRDRHKNWPYFPGSSNPEMVLTAVPNLYIYTVKPLKNTPYYMVHFTRDSIEFYDNNIGGMDYFGIIDANGTFKVEYNKSNHQFIDDDRIIVKDETYAQEEKPSDTCDVYNIKTLIKTREVINKIVLPATKEEFNEAYGTEQGQARFKEKYQTDFFKNLSGIQSVENQSDRYYGGSNYRGYGLYKDANGRLYKTASYDDSSQLDMLSPQVAGYTPVINNNSKNVTANIRPMGEPIILYNNVNGGLNSSYAFFYEYHQTWLLYYAAVIGKNSTSFKLEGSEKNEPYTQFYQLNKVYNDKDTLFFIADNKLWKLYKK